MPGFLKYTYYCQIGPEHRFLYACQAYAVVLIFHLHLEFWYLVLILFLRLAIFMKLILPRHSESRNSKWVTVLLANVLILNSYEQIWFTNMIFCPCACLCTTWICVLAFTVVGRWPHHPCYLERWIVVSPDLNTGHWTTHVQDQQESFTTEPSVLPMFFINNNILLLILSSAHL